MNMAEAVKSVLTKYVGFSGRARRSEYWYWTLATILVTIAVALLESALGIRYDDSGPISTVLGLAIFLPGLAVTFRRLHDTGRSGWWVGGFYLSIIVFTFVAVTMAFGVGSDVENSSSLLAGFGVLTMLFILGFLVYVIVLLVFLCQDSYTGPNRYGPNPKNEGNYDIFE